MEYHPAPFGDWITEIRDPWPVIERLRLALNEARRYTLGAENPTGHLIEDLLDQLPSEDDLMTTSELSPQAQAVVKAAVSQICAEKIAAAVLRAGILNVFFQETLGMTACDGFNQALEKLLALANELDDAT